MKEMKEVRLSPVRTPTRPERESSSIPCPGFVGVVSTCDRQTREVTPTRGGTPLSHFQHLSSTWLVFPSYLLLPHPPHPHPCLSRKKSEFSPMDLLSFSTKHAQHGVLPVRQLCGPTTRQGGTGCCTRPDGNAHTSLVTRAVPLRRALTLLLTDMCVPRLFTVVSALRPAIQGDFTEIVPLSTVPKGSSPHFSEQRMLRGTIVPATTY